MSNWQRKFASPKDKHFCENFIFTFCHKVKLFPHKTIKVSKTSSAPLLLPPPPGYHLFLPKEIIVIDCFGYCISELASLYCFYYKQVFYGSYCGVLSRKAYCQCSPHYRPALSDYRTKLWSVHVYNMCCMVCDGTCHVYDMCYMCCMVWSYALCHGMTSPCSMAWYWIKEWQGMLWDVLVMWFDVEYNVVVVWFALERLEGRYQRWCCLLLCGH